VSCCEREGAASDLVRSRAALLLWYLPATFVVVGLLWVQARPFLWVPAFAVMGLACLFNARRCGRLHCHITGPLFVLAAIATVVDGSAWIAVASTLVTALAFGLERLRGFYVAR
jgi:hypothetical protein